MKLYDFRLSGNCYKVRLLLSHLGRPYQRVPVDIVHGENRRPEYLAKNPIGRVPLLEVEAGRLLAESPAILFYLSEGTPFQPTSTWERALMWQWMAFEQYEHEPAIAKARAWKTILHSTEGRDLHLRLREMEKLGYRALTVMESHLRDQDFFTGKDYGIADIALYAYTHVADEGGFDLGGFPSVREWLTRVKSQPRHITIDE